MPDEEQDDRNGPVWNETGTIHLWVDNEKIRLRVPRLGEFRHLHDLWQESASTLAEVNRGNMEWMDEVNARREAEGVNGEPRPPTDEEREEDQRRGREATALEEKLIPEWWRAVVGELAVGDKEAALAKIADTPVWMVLVAPVNRTITHWRTVPSSSGAR